MEAAASIRSAGREARAGRRADNSGTALAPSASLYAAALRGFAAPAGGGPTEVSPPPRLDLLAATISAGDGAGPSERGGPSARWR